MVSVLVSAGPPGFGPLVGLGEGEAPRIEIQYLKGCTRKEIFISIWFPVEKSFVDLKKHFLQLNSDYILMLQPIKLSN